MRGLGPLIALMELIAFIGILIYTMNLTAEFNEKYEDIKNGDTDALTDFIENRADDLVEIAINEVEDALIGAIGDIDR
ncbi:MAG TPA: hypothetical protein ENI51_07075 [Candidatus Atribacteria bacterium]|nr:hypothetical protein [Candidatus Atribacteria bacterium]